MIPEGFEILADGRIKNPRGEWQKVNQNPGGYYQFTHSKNGKETCYAVHRLVCEQFHGPKPFPGAQVRHLNGDNTDNRASNLRWGTAVENGRDRHRHGTIRSKLTWDQVREIRERYAAGGVTTRDLAAEYGVTVLPVNRILRNVYWYDPDYTPPETTKHRRVHARRTEAKSLANRLTLDQVHDIRKRYAAKEGTTRSLGAEYGVSAHTISKIIRGLIFPDPDYTPPLKS